MDRRQRKTRQAIFSAFSRLLENKHFNKITVQEIIDEADVGRTTFYAHFPTKDDLLREMCEDLFGHVFAKALAREKEHDFSRQTGTVSNRLVHLLYHLKEQQRDISRLLTGESSDLFMGFFKAELQAAFHEMDALFPRSVPPVYAENFYVASFAETVRLWIRRGMQESPEAVVACYLQMCGK
jgi:AcrR family transcriptional regulator